MTNEQYETIIGILADKIKEQDNKIAVQEWQIESLEKKLQEAEVLLPKKQTLEIR